jgi:putative ABC transport system permease protein
VRRLEQLGVANVRERRGRSALTVLGVTLGVAILFGVVVASASIDAGVDRAVERVIGDADAELQPVGARDGRLPAASVQRVRELPGVAEATAQVRVAGTRAGEYAVLLGLDSRAARVNELRLLAGRPAARAGEAVVVIDGERRPPLGSRTALRTQTGVHRLVVVGVADRSDAGQVSGAALVTTIGTAQRIADAGRAVDLVRIVLAAGVDRARWLERHRNAVAGGTVVDARDANAGFAALLDVVEATLAVFAMLALLVGVLMVHLTVSTSVAERTHVHAVLRAVGATPRQLGRVVVAESLTLALAGTIAGLVLGGLVAIALMRLLAGLLGIDAPSLVIPEGAVLGSACLALGAAGAAAVPPARRSARVSPVAAMRGVVTTTSDRPARAWPLGLAAFGAGLAAALASEDLRLTGVALIVALLGAVAVVPRAIRPIAAVIEVLSRRFGGAVARVGVAHVLAERGRSAYTLALVMVGLAMTLAVAVVQASFERTLDTVLDRQFSADLQVYAPDALPSEARAAVVQARDVARTTALRYGKTELVRPGADARLDLVVIDPASYFDVQGFAWRDGDDDSARAALARGGGVLVPQALAREHGLRVGEEATLRTRAGTRRFRVAGTFSAFRFYAGAVVVGVRDGRALFGARAPRALLAQLEPGARPSAVAATIRSRLRANDGAGGDADGLTVVDGATAKRRARDELRGYVGMTGAVLAIAVAVGALALASTLATSVVRRRRELGLLRAVGAGRRQIAGLVLVEAGTLVVAAIVLGTPLGLAVAAILLRATSDSLGFSVGYHVSPAALVTLIAVAASVALLAALLPARRATRLTVVEAIRYD